MRIELDVVDGIQYGDKIIYGETKGDRLTFAYHYKRGVITTASVDIKVYKTSYENGTVDYAIYNLDGKRTSFQLFEIIRNGVILWQK